MMENFSRPKPPNTSEGCYHCGGGLDQILTSKTLPPGMSVALCSSKECQSLTTAGAKFDGGAK